MAAAQGLHDPHDGTGREGSAHRTGDLDDFTSPTQRDRSTRTHIELPGYHARCKVSQVIEDMLRELTIEDIEEKASSPACLTRDASSVRAS
jgi:hypothetical protein